MPNDLRIFFALFENSDDFKVDVQMLFVHLEYLFFRIIVAMHLDDIVGFVSKVQLCDIANQPQNQHRVAL